MARSLLTRLIVALLALSSVACAERGHVSLVARSPTVEATLDLEPKISSLSEDRIKVSGVLTVSNLTDVAQEFSNRWLWLEGDDGIRSRAYVDRVASQLMDFDTVEIEPGEQLTVPVYWVFLESDRAKVDLGSLMLEIQQGE